MREILEAAETMSMLYQPIVALAERRVVGYEALARFGTEAARPPHLWFSDAHARGVGVELEIIAVERALDLHARFFDRRYVSVNVSAATLRSPQLRSFLEQRAVSGNVVLELTEHEGISDYAALIEAMAPLRELGIALAVDDAGAGFASMRHIVDLRPDIIKLDRTLVSDIDTDGVRRAFTTALRTFAEATGAALCAEGIETPEELGALLELEIPLGQGHLLGRPAPPPAF